MGSSSTTAKGGATTIAVPVPPSVDTRTSTIVVAASNSLDPTLAPAAYRCSGVADNVEMNAALVAAAAVNGSVELLEGDYNTVLTLSVAVNVTLKAVGWGAVIYFNAGGHAITLAGDNVKLRDFKVIIVAGAGEVGTRPNAIYATGKTNVEIMHLWLYGDQTMADGGSNLRQSGIMFGDNTTFCKIGFCTIENFERNGVNLEGTSGNEVTYIETEGNLCYNNLNDEIRLDYAHYCTVIGNTCQNGISGISLSSSSNNNTMTGNTCPGNTNGIYLFESTDNTMTGNICQGNTSYGIYLKTHSNNNTVMGNTCQEGGTGIILSESTNNTVMGNTNSGNNVGIYVNYHSDNNTIMGNTCNQNIMSGIWLDTSSSNTIVGNTCNENDVNNTGTYDGITIEDDSDYNLAMCNTCNDNDRWGISIGIAADDCVDNWIKNNTLQGNTSGPFNGGGTDTKLATKIFQFIQGTTFISADGSAKGWEINAEADMAITLPQLSNEVQQVVKLKIWAVALDAPPGAGGYMHLDLLFNGGGSLEDYNLVANSWPLANFNGEEADYANGKVIHWVVEDGDVGNEIRNLRGGDSLELKVNGGTAAGDDGATNAVIKTLEIEYV